MGGVTKAFGVGGWKKWNIKKRALREQEEKGI